MFSAETGQPLLTSLTHQVPCYSYGQKLSKLAILRTPATTSCPGAVGRLRLQRRPQQPQLLRVRQRCTRIPSRPKAGAKKRKAALQPCGQQPVGRRGRQRSHPGRSYLHPAASKGTSKTSLSEACWDSRLPSVSLGPEIVCDSIPGASQWCWW